MSSLLTVVLAPGWAPGCCGFGDPSSFPSGPHVGVLGGEHGSPAAVALTPYDFTEVLAVFPYVPTPMGRPFDAFTDALDEVSAAEDLVLVVA